MVLWRGAATGRRGGVRVGAGAVVVLAHQRAASDGGVDRRMRVK